MDYGTIRPTVGVADSESESIRNIIRLWGGRKFQDGFHHGLHLFLVGSSVASEGLLYLEGSILEKFYAKCLKCQEDGASGLAYRYDGLLVFEEEYFLNGGFVWSVPEDNFSEIVRYFGNPFRYGEG